MTYEEITGIVYLLLDYFLLLHDLHAIRLTTLYLGLLGLSSVTVALLLHLVPLAVAAVLVGDWGLAVLRHE